MHQNCAVPQQTFTWCPLDGVWGAVQALKVVIPDWIDDFNHACPDIHGIQALEAKDRFLEVDQADKLRKRSSPGGELAFVLELAFMSASSFADFVNRRKHRGKGERFMFRKESYSAMGWGSDSWMGVMQIF